MSACAQLLKTAGLHLGAGKVVSMSHRALVFTPAAVALGTAPAEPWTWLTSLLEASSYFILDPRFAGDAAVCTPRAVLDAPDTAPLHAAAELLHKLRLNADAGLNGVQVSAVRTSLFFHVTS